MAIPLTGSGGLFVRLGHLIYLNNANNTYRGTTIPAKVATLVQDLANGDPSDAGAVQAALGSLQAGSATFHAALQAIAANIVVAMANADSPQADQQFTTAWPYVYNQMIAGSATVLRNTVGISSTSGGSNAGNPVIATSSLNPLGLPLEYQFGETITGACTADSQSATSSAIALREPVLFKGQALVGDRGSFGYPGGSGITIPLTCVDASQAQGSNTANLLANGSFETFGTPNIPDGWHAIVGSVGTLIIKSTAQHYDGLASLEFVGDASTLTSVYQEFGSDTTQKLAPLTQYAGVLFAKVDVAPAAGVLEISLTDGTNATTQDNNGANNAATKTLTTIGTSFVPVTFVFRTPKVLPAAFRLRIRLSTALSSGSNVFIDRVAFTPMTQLYIGGPFASMFSANTPLVIGDSFSIIPTNSRNGIITSGIDQLLPMRANGFTIPSVVSSPSLSEGLVV